jgi:hypothetical protein
MKKIYEIFWSVNNVFLTKGVINRPKMTQNRLKYFKKKFFEGKVTKFIKDQAKVICKKLMSFGLKRYEYKQN